MRRLIAALLVLAAAAAVLGMRGFLLNALAFFPSRGIHMSPAEAGLRFADVAFETEDGERLHAWWIESLGRERLGHLLLFHGNAGNVGDRVLHARLLAEAGFDVFLFDYRGYGRSTGSPDEEGTYRDGRAARAALLRQPGVDPARIVYLGESLGGAVAVALAGEAPPLALVLQSSFTSVREMARVHYPFLPEMLVPDAYPSLARISRLRCPVLVMHGDLDDIVPVAHARALHEAAPGRKRLHLFTGAGHNDLVPLAGRAYGELVEAFVRGLSLS